MGQAENKLKKQIRLSKIQSGILKTVAGVGLISVAALAPNALQVLGIIGKGKNRRKLYNANNCIGRMIKNRLLKIIVESDGTKSVELTPLGHEKAEQLKFWGYKLPVAKKWDKKFRIVIFDIEERRKKERELIRKTLANIGFIRLQDSVWVYPYDCEDFIMLLKTDSRLGLSVLYVIADHIENDKTLREAFNLPLN